MVLAVHRHPLAGSGPGRHPDDEAADERHRRPQGDGLVRQSPVQVHRRDDEGDLGRQQPDQEGLEDRGHADNSSAGDDPPLGGSPRAVGTSRRPAPATPAQGTDPRQDVRLLATIRCEVPSMSFTPYDRPVRAAFIGLGRIYDLNVRAYLDNPDVEVVALVDPSEERRDERAADWPGRRPSPPPPSSRPAAWRWTPWRCFSRSRSTKRGSSSSSATAGTSTCRSRCATTSRPPGGWSTPPRPTTACCGSWRTTSSTSPW